MSEFDDVILGVREVFESIFGDDVAYTPAGGTLATVTADIQVDADEFREDGRGESRLKTGTLNGSTDVFGNWNRDDIVTHNGITWQFDSESGRDAAFVRIRLSEAEIVRRVADNDRIRRGRS